MYLQYNENVDYFSLEELRHLAGAMGFPKEVFESNIPNDLFDEKEKITTRDLIKCIEDRCFHVDLHFTVNLKSATYNATCLKEAVKFISKRYLSFKELLEVRLAFQSYEAYDQNGMKIDELIFLRTLKMCGRVISPKKLMHKLKHLKLSFKVEGRIQFFEFLDLLELCEFTKNQILTGDELHSPVEKSWTRLYKVDNFKRFMTPQDKKIWKHLNEEYKNEELNYNQPKLKSNNFIKNPLTPDDFRMQVKLANKQYETLHKSLRNSSKQVKLARGGFTFVRPQTYSHQNKKDMRSKRTMSASTGKNTFENTPRAPSRTSIPATELTDGFPSTRSKKKLRPQSSPPVMTDRLLKDSKSKVENVQFDMCTEHQRWFEYYHDNITHHLPNYHEVLRRMRKPFPAPRRKRFYRRPRPNPNVISRLSSHEPNPPLEHLQHCDALSCGIGTDNHSMLLKNKARKIRCKSAPVSSSNKFSATEFKPSKVTNQYSSLLQSLMEEYGYVSEDDSITEDKTNEGNLKNELAESSLKNEVEKIEPTELGSKRCSEEVKGEHYSEQGDHASLILSESSCSFTKSPRLVPENINTIENDAEKKQQFIDEFFKWRKHKKTSVTNLIKETGYYRPCVKLDHGNQRNISSPQSFKKVFRPPSAKTSESQTENLSDFEKHVLDPENLRIRHDVSLADDEVDFYMIERKVRSLRRIAKRYSGKDRRWFSTLVKTTEINDSPIKPLNNGISVND
ncbi:uncharacterized protein LOC120334365 [Styela clava]